MSDLAAYSWRVNDALVTAQDELNPCIDFLLMVTLAFENERIWAEDEREAVWTTTLHALNKAKAAQKALAACPRPVGPLPLP